MSFVGHDRQLIRFVYVNGSGKSESRQIHFVQEVLVTEQVAV